MYGRISHEYIPFMFLFPFSKHENPRKNLRKNILYRKGIVEELAKFGVIVHTCDNNVEFLNESLQVWKDMNLNVTGSVCDVSIRDEREKLIKEVHSLFDGKLNIRVNNVGISGTLKLTTSEISAEDLSAVMRTNFESSFNLSQLAHPLLKELGNGILVFISSMASLLGLGAGVSLYSSSKGAINSLTRSLAVEWACDNIRVNAVAPGVVNTHGGQQLIQNAEWARKELVRIPIKRFAEPEEIGSVVAFLCMPASSYVNGQIISVDAGCSINGIA
ncbi:hypothetical protein LUZ60_015264 [Juncus effusus]|nr:hypothetical protein LUZ60_015264 [Juncus effusus]